MNKILENKQDFIIKPSVDSSHGNGVRKINASSIDKEMLGIDDDDDD